MKFVVIIFVRAHEISDVFDRGPMWRFNADIQSTIRMAQRTRQGKSHPHFHKHFLKFQNACAMHQPFPLTGKNISPANSGTLLCFACSELFALGNV